MFASASSRSRSLHPLPSMSRIMAYLRDGLVMMGGLVIEFTTAILQTPIDKLCTNEADRISLVEVLQVHPLPHRHHQFNALAVKRLDVFDRSVGIRLGVWLLVGPSILQWSTCSPPRHAHRHPSPITTT